MPALPPTLTWLNQRLKLSPAQVFRALVCGVLIAVAVGFWVRLDWRLSLLAAIGLAGFWLYSKRGTWLVLVVVGFLVGATRVNFSHTPLPPASFIGNQQFSGQIAEEPRLGDKAARYVVEVDSLNRARVLVTSRPFPLYRYGDRLQVSCRNLTEVTFEGYRQRGITRECAFPELELVAEASGSFRAGLLALRQRAGEVIKQLVPEPYASLATGMLWGDDSGLPQDVVAAFRRTGTTHLVAVSGFNVMVLTEVLFWLLIALGLWRQQASIAVLLLVVAFVFFTGAEPAVVRAASMGSLVVLGRLISRKADKLNLLTGAAAGMLIVSPALIVNLGFQLSFAAMAGLLFLGPKLRQRLTFLPEALSIREGASQTLAATLTTTPIILWRLGQFSVLAPLANLMIGPVVIWVFMFGLPLVLAAALWQPIAQVFAWGLTLVMAYVIGVVEWLGALPFATLASPLWGWLALIVVYGLMWFWLRGSRLFASGRI